MPHSAKEVSIEVLFAQRLASNQPQVRDRHVKKLSTFLAAKASAAAAGRGALGEEELLKLWKGLHYCFWMSDKPMVQEELAEKISNMVHVFSVAESELGFEPFVRCALVTLGREWFGLDKWRVDKFMMLVRRLLRQTFRFCKGVGWRNADNMAAVITESVLRGGQASRGSPPSLGFQLHFVDVFLEELAKVDGGDDGVGDEVIRALLRPFLNELRDGRDDRLRGHIEDRIFQHLMRQSDVGIAYEQDGDDDSEGEEDVECEEEEGKGSDDDDAEMASDDSDKEEEEEEDAAMDPRAGRVDVTIPQLMVDYEKLSDELFSAGTSKEVGQAQRRVLYRLAKQFRALDEGRYPLAPEYTDDGEVDLVGELPRVDMKKERKRKAGETAENMREVAEERKRYKAAMLAKRKGQKQSQKEEEEDVAASDNDDEKSSDSGVEDQSVSDEEDRVPSMNDKAAVVGDEPDEQAEPEVKKTKIKKSSNKKEKKPSASILQEKVGEDKKQKKKSKKKKKSESQPNEVNPKDDDGDRDENPALDKKSRKRKLKAEEDTEGKDCSERPKKAKKKKTSQQNGEEKPVITLAAQSEVESSSVAKKKVKKKKSKKAASAEADSDELPTTSLPGAQSPPKIVKSAAPAPVFFRKAASKVAAAKKPASPKTPPSQQQGKRKKINFVGNRYQSVMEHSKSIQESPDIPFAPERRPKQGLLKNKHDISVVHTPSPLLGLKAVQKNTKINGRSKVMARMTAADFF